MMSVVDIHVYVKYTYICMYYISYISYRIYTSNLPNAFCPFFRLAFKTTLLDLVLDASHKGLVPPKIGEFNSFNFNFPSVTSSLSTNPYQNGQKKYGFTLFHSVCGTFSILFGELGGWSPEIHGFHTAAVPAAHIPVTWRLHLPAKII